MAEYRILTYDTESEACNKLASALPARTIRPDASTYRYKSGDIIINWGLYGDRGLPLSVNQHNAVRTCCSKLRSYKAFNNNGVRTVEWATNPDYLIRWLSSGFKVYARQHDYGYQGQGLQVFTPNSSLPSTDFRIYTKAFPIHREFRIYVWRDQVIGLYEKKEPPGVTLDHDIRATDDWLYCTRGLDEYPVQLPLQAIAATHAIGLDFAGCDVALDNRGNVCVFECNSAPWLGPMVSKRLAAKIREAYPL